jgi:hypothetical protein
MTVLTPYQRAKRYLFVVAPIGLAVPIFILSYAYTALFEPTSISALALISLGSANVGFALGNVAHNFLMTRYKMKVGPEGPEITNQVAGPSATVELDPTPTPSAITVNISSTN